MDEKLKYQLREAMEDGKEAVEDMKKVIENISKEMTKKSKEEGEDLHKNAAELFQEVTENLKKLGKTSIEFTQAAFSGIIAGMKESVGTEEEENLFKGIASSLGSGAKHLGKAAGYVAKESLKSVTDLFHKEKKENPNSSQEKNQ